MRTPGYGDAWFCSRKSRQNEGSRVIIFAKSLRNFFMSNPLVHAFFVGRAIAEVLGEQFEVAVTDALSDLGKFDAEQRERLRQFTEEVMERASRAEGMAAPGQSTSTVGTQPQDLQAMIDDLRAEIAQLRVEMQRYRSRTP